MRSKTLSVYGLILVLAVSFFEWVDFSIYLYLAPTIFSKLFFPQSQHSLTLTFALYAVSYLARPLGGWWFGRQADSEGRKRPLMFSALIMGLSTAGICLLPGYASIGILSTWLLLMFRVGQGIAVGGESNTSAIFLIEHYRQYPLYACCFIAAIGALSMSFGGLLTFIIQITSWDLAWRVIFGTLGVASIVISYLRTKLTESPEFDGQPITMKQLWQNHRQGVINVTIAAGYTSFVIYMCNVFWTSYAKSVHLFADTTVTWCITIAQTAAPTLAFSTVWLFQPKQVKKLLMGSCMAMAMAAPLLFGGTTFHHPLIALTGLGFYIIGNALLCNSIYYYLYLQLPAGGRCLGVSFLWGIAATFGAITLPVVQYLVQKGHYNSPILVVVTISALTWLTLSKKSAEAPYAGMVKTAL